MGLVIEEMAVPPGNTPNGITSFRLPSTPRPSLGTRCSVLAIRVSPFSGDLLNVLHSSSIKDLASRITHKNSKRSTS